MARQFRDQLEEEAHNLETKVSIDPGIDTSLEPKPAATPPPAPAPAATENAPPTPYQDVEEEFYPPDHHMHSANRAAAEAAPPPDAQQGELDLTDNPDQPKAP
jgi:hypothetical protein